MRGNSSHCDVCQSSPGTQWQHIAKCIFTEDHRISNAFTKLDQKTLGHRAVDWISQGSIANSGGLSLASLFPSLQHKAADCCPHYFSISLGDWEKSMTLLFFLSYWKAQILIPWKYLSVWACLYNFLLASYKWYTVSLFWRLQAERDCSETRRRLGFLQFLFEMFQVVPISKKVIW